LSVQPGSFGICRLLCLYRLLIGGIERRHPGEDGFGKRLGVSEDGAGLAEEFISKKPHLLGIFCGIFFFLALARPGGKASLQPSLARPWSCAAAGTLASYVRQAGFGRGRSGELLREFDSKGKRNDLQPN